jgi:hypothetical protein
MISIWESVYKSIHQSLESFLLAKTNKNWYYLSYKWVLRACPILGPFKLICYCLNLFRVLKVNFHKSLEVEVNVNSSRLEETARVLNCKRRYLPFKYSSLSIGGYFERLLFWLPLIDRIRKLSSWRVVICIQMVVFFSSRFLLELVTWFV